MWHSLKGLLSTTWNLSSKFACTMGIAFVVLVLLGIALSAAGDAILSAHWVAYLIVVTVTYFLAVIPPVTKMATLRHKYVPYVVLWGLFSLVFFLAAFYLIYYALVTTPEGLARWDRVLNLPPVLFAAIAAAIGWYAATQYSAKNNRTNNAFSLVMQTRCNTEFMKRAVDLSKNWPPTTQMTNAHQPCFPINARHRFEELKRVGAERPLSATETTEFAAYDEQMLTGIEAAKYLLNFYEFMAYGIYAGDLDEDLLYETISPAVVFLFDRTLPLRTFLNGPDGDKLAFQHLSSLVDGYQKTENGRDITIIGWSNRLELERITYRKSRATA